MPWAAEARQAAPRGLLGQRNAAGWFVNQIDDCPVSDGLTERNGFLRKRLSCSRGLPGRCWVSALAGPLSIDWIDWSSSRNERSLTRKLKPPTVFVPSGALTACADGGNCVAESGGVGLKGQRDLLLVVEARGSRWASRREFRIGRRIASETAMTTITIRRSIRVKR